MTILKPISILFQGSFLVKAQIFYSNTLPGKEFFKALHLPPTLQPHTLQDTKSSPLRRFTHPLPARWGYPKLVFIMRFARILAGSKVEPWTLQ